MSVSSCMSSKTCFVVYLRFSMWIIRLSTNNDSFPSPFPIFLPHVPSCIIVYFTPTDLQAADMWVLSGFLWVFGLCWRDIWNSLETRCSPVYIHVELIEASSCGLNRRCVWNTLKGQYKPCAIGCCYRLPQIWASQPDQGSLLICIMIQCSLVRDTVLLGKLATWSPSS